MHRILSVIAALFFLFFLSIFLSISETKASNVVINEIAWMGTKSSYGDEWIELYNNTDNDVNLKGWKIISSDKFLNIPLEGTIPKKGFFLLERSDDLTIPEIKADLIYKGSLNNKGKHLILLNNNGEIEDEINCASGWFAGNNTTKQTMERKDPSQKGNDPTNWQSSRNPQGTPRKRNSFFKKTPQRSNTNKNQNFYYSSNIFINEIMPSPKGPDSKNEWIEIANENKFDVNIENWEITDTKGKTTTYTFPENTIIKSNGFLVLYRPETKITLNNKEDGVILYSPDHKNKSEVFYKEAPLGKSFSKINNKWFWTSQPTPGKENMPQKARSFLKKEEALETKASFNIVRSLPSNLLDNPLFQEEQSSFFFLLIEAFCFALGSAIFFVYLKRIYF